MLGRSLVFWTVLGFAQCTWPTDLLSPDGWRFQNNLIFRMEDTKANGSSFADKFALRVDYGNVGVSAVKKPDKNKLELEFYLKDKAEGRGKKMGSMMVPFLIGASKAGIATMIFGTVKLFALQSLMIAKVALIVSIVLAVAALKKKNVGSPSPVEVEEYAAPEVPVFQYGPSGYGTSGSSSANIYDYSPYSGYAPSAAESIVHQNYAPVAPPSIGNDNVPVILGNQQVPAAKRRDQVRKRKKKKVVPTIFTIRRYSEPT